jgi:plastocyanin
MAMNLTRLISRRVLPATILLAVCTLGCASSGLDRLPSLGVAELGSDVQVARLRLESYYFEPSRLMVQVDVPVRLVLENGTLLTGHDFSIFAPGARLEIDAYVPARQQVTVQFIPEVVGEFRYYCNIDDHAERGEVGTLVVVEELAEREPSNPH